MTGSFFFTAFAPFCALAALAIAIYAVWLRSKAPARWRAELAELEDEVGKLAALVRKLNQRAVMRERREEDEPVSKHDTGTARLKGEDDVAWKRRMRALISTGQLKHEG